MQSWRQGQLHPGGAQKKTFQPSQEDGSAGDNPEQERDIPDEALEFFEYFCISVQQGAVQVHKQSFSIKDA